MTIAAGDALPDINLWRQGPNGPEELTIADLFSGKKIAVFGVPGAFTRTCHNKHVPSFLEKASAFRDKGVDAIFCLSVNDVAVLDAWANVTGAADDIMFLSDWNAALAVALGLSIDRSATMGVRFVRFSMLVEDGVVKVVNTEDRPGVFENTNADNLLKSC